MVEAIKVYLNWDDNHNNKLQDRWGCRECYSVLEKGVVGKETPLAETVMAVYFLGTRSVLDLIIFNFRPRGGRGGTHYGEGEDGKCTFPLRASTSLYESLREK